jgi:predicted transcriptional regulator
MNELFQPESGEDRDLRIKAGLDDVLAGMIIPHSEVKAWVKSLVDAASASLDRKTDH